ncbi:MAG: anthranilate phosphoribosyltransferase [Acidobacteriota bacterium]
MPFLDYLHQAADRHSLSADQAEDALHLILAGEATLPQVTALLTALRVKGETAAELTGFARAMRKHALPIPTESVPRPLIDTCGTGGDGHGTFNISTVTAFVIAGAGLSVAKHGNRSISSRCGSADILEALGVNIALSAEQMGEALRQCGIAFLYAPAVHPSMKFVQPARLELKMRTIFNLLGPLTNPARADIQLIGAPSAPAAELMANALTRLPVQRALVVHGTDGLDEITTTGLTIAFEVCRGEVQQQSLMPMEFGLPLASLADLAGGDALDNATIARAILGGELGPQRDIVVANAAAAIYLAGRAFSYGDGAELACQSIDSGAALAKLNALTEFTQAVSVSRS